MIDREQIENWDQDTDLAAEAAASDCLEFAPERRADQVPLASNAPRVIGLCGLAGSGKSTVAAILADYGYTRVRFADPLKAMVRTLLTGAGLSWDVVERMVEGDLKEVPHPVLGGKSPRHVMQTLGTEWGRTCMGLDFWADLARPTIRGILARGGRVVVEDCRFPNEATTIHGSAVDRLMGVRQLWKVIGRGGIDGGHESEAYQSALPVDLFLDNAGSLEALERAVLEQILG